MLTPYCVDLKKLVVTKFDCSCAPSGLDRHEFAIDTEDQDEVISKAKEFVDGEEVTLCEHF